jgi:hypothetical protein
MPFANGRPIKDVRQRAAESLQLLFTFPFVYHREHFILLLLHGRDQFELCSAAIQVVSLPVNFEVLISGKIIS